MPRRLTRSSALPKLTAALLGAHVLALACAASAREPREVALVSPTHADASVREAAVRVSAELRGAGFTVRDVIADVADDGTLLAVGLPIPREDPAVVLQGSERGARAEVYAKRGARPTHLEPSDDGASAANLAVRAVETIAAVLDAPPPAPPPPVAPPRQPPPVIPIYVPRAPSAPWPTPFTPRPRPPVQWPSQTRAPAPSAPSAPTQEHGDLTLEANGGVLISGLGLAPALGVGLAFGAPFGARLAVVPPIGNITVDAREGSVSLHQTVVALEGLFAPRLDGTTVLAPRLAVGFNVYDLGVNGVGNAPYVGEQHHVQAFGATATAALAIRLASVLELDLGVRAFTMSPGPIVTIAEREAATAGSFAAMPFAGLGLGAIR